MLILARYIQTPSPLQGLRGFRPQSMKKSLLPLPQSHRKRGKNDPSPASEVTLSGYPPRRNSRSRRGGGGIGCMFPFPLRPSVSYHFPTGRYLPPPVLDVLSDKQLEATRRAAIITTALTWFFSNIPIDVLPPAVRPALALLKTLIPLVGYIGTFISWSWGTVQSYDTGRQIFFSPPLFLGWR